jgi:uncharacterized membrane protein
MSNRTHIHIPVSIGDKVADAVVAGMGSWKFIIIQSVIVVTWIGLNTLGFFVWKWDVYPFILLNLLFSTQAAYASPLILMASNRGAAKDEMRDDLEATEVKEIYDNHRVLMDLNKEVLELERQQIDILDKQNDILDAIKEKQTTWQTPRKPAPSKAKATSSVTEAAQPN